MIPEDTLWREILHVQSVKLTIDRLWPDRIYTADFVNFSENTPKFRGELVFGAGITDPRELVIRGIGELV